MDDLRMLTEAHGFFTRRDALELGYDDASLTSGVRQRFLVRLRRGAYCFADLWASYDDAARHLVRCRAVLRSLGDGFALSHVSAALAHGVTVWGHDLGRVHVTRLDGRSSRTEGDVVFHCGRLSEADVVEVSGVRATVPDRAAVETATLVDGERALVVFDSVAHLGLCSVDELFARFLRLGAWPATRHLQVPIRMADGRADGPGESRGRWLFRSAGIPAPVLQYEVWDSAGRLVGTCDWGWPELGLLGEFDGRLKYGRLLQPGQDPGEVVFAEKCREDEMREVTGHSMVRIVWTDYDRPRVTAQRVRSLMRRTA